MLNYGKQSISDDDIESVVNVLKSDFLTQGPMVPKFEEIIAKKVGSKHAVAMHNATGALHTACLALGVGVESLVWISPISFVASANCGRYCGADVDFVDIDPLTFNICPEKLLEKLEHAELIGRLPTVVIVVHMAGQSCDMRRISELSLRFGFKIIEDASHALGGYYEGEHVGRCSFSHITVFSFHPVKIITTAEGGMCLCNDDAIYDKLILLRSHGITRDPSKLAFVNEIPWYYEQQALGFNYRMTDLQAALGISQSKKLEQFVARRNEIANEYDYNLSKLPVQTPIINEKCYSSFHLYIIQIKEHITSKSRDWVFNELRSAGIGVNLHYIPIHTQPYYARMGFKPNDFPSAVAYARAAITLPIFPKMQNNDVAFVCNEVARIIKK